MPKTTKRTVRTKKGVKEYTYLGCPITRSRTAWCFRLCVPDGNGKGECGRIAPHGIKSRTQLAIEEHNRQLREARVEELESAYLARPENEAYEPGVRVTGGETEIVIPLHERDRVAQGATSPPLCFKAMHDAAQLAVESLVVKGHVANVEFSVKLTGIAGSDALIARSLFVGMSDELYLTESVLTDAEGHELGRASGVFSVSE